MADDITRSPEEGGRIVDEPIGEALAKRYLAYALSTITSRALPDVRDGLKPVHRRVLYAMKRLNLTADAAFRKSAKVVGDVMGDYHPHGDQSIYDALVRLAQDFNSRYPLIDGQGNFGNIDGDSPAAMRYTESRMTRAAEALLEGIDEDAVDFRPSYDGSKEEPAVLPAAFPNLLANGSSGIAVGMATSIPPHNLAELIDGCLLLIENAKASTAELLKVIPGPDFPTGGIVVEAPESIHEAYETGRGSFRVRARWQTEDLGRGMWRIVVTEIPHLVQKSKLVEALAAVIENKKAPLLADVRDESAEDIRLVLEPKSRTVEPEILMESLFKLTALESRISLNMNVLDAQGAPRVMSLKDVLRAFLDHRRDVLQRRTSFRLEKIAQRLDVLAGLLIVYLNLDEVIRIIRNEDDPKAKLIQRFKLNETQAEAILNTRLRQLRKLEEMEIRREDAALRAEQAELQGLLEDTRKQWRKIAGELKETRKLFGPGTPFGKRRTELGEAAAVSADVDIEAFVAREPVTVVLSEKGWIRALRGHVADMSEIKYKEGDGPEHIVQCQTTDKLLLFASDGRAFTLDAHKLPGGRGHGEPVRLTVDMADIDQAVALFVYEEGSKRLVASQEGYGFVVPESEMLATKRSGKQVLNGRAMQAAKVIGDQVAVIGERKKLLIFALSEVPEMNRGKGVKLQSYHDRGLADVKVFDKAEGLTWEDGAGRVRQVAEWKDFRGKRGGAGKVAPKGFSRSGRFSDVIG
ncbi:DNA topoisomerase IV subunit A [Candidatus Viadribacter manganicus]|uniref:DNA topoisomerase 4 subunit A n=1 Tax=Candidatus Viadribacter manganicus TaxID=1759059 RepID=A0A1B1ADK1_9PROT|nr:DNA topoisomerase IV subunit A [Candidatus Viadribacter manganicus]ANP44638.1 DNA topoisomerase IV subunit A [Candidatus Viadribacter manganicus]